MTETPFVKLHVEIDRESDGRWIAEVPELPGVLAYGASREEADSAVRALALRILADRLESGELQAMESVEIGPVMLARIARRTGLLPDDL